MPKEVRYWAGRAAGGKFVASDEVDTLDWVPVAEARARVTRALDADVLAAFEDAPVDTTRDGDPAPRRDRQAQGLGRRRVRAPLQPPAVSRRRHDSSRCWPPTASPGSITSPMRRCVQTVEPYAAAAGIAIEKIKGLAEEADPADATRARAAVRSLAACGGPLVVCSHGPVLPGLFESLHAATGATPPGHPLRKSEFAVLHLLDGRAVATELHRP